MPAAPGRLGVAVDVEDRGWSRRRLAAYLGRLLRSAFVAPPRQGAG